MSLVWLFPAGLAALAALLLPLLIHLARRDEQQRIDFAALRWLSAKPRPRRRIRFNEWPLLLVRLLLLALLAVLLAQPALHGIKDNTPRVVLVPGVDVAAARNAVAAEKAQWLWLAPGFPALDAPPPASSQPIASLLRELDATLPPAAPLRVVVPSLLDGWDAQRPLLSRTVQWQVIESAQPAIAAATPAAAPRLHIRHDHDGRAALPWLRAVGNAWNPTAPTDIADDGTPFNDADGVHIWLSANPLPAPTEDRSPLLADARTPVPNDAQRLPLWRDQDGNVVIEQVTGDNRQWLRWAAPLQPATMPALLDADFPRRLQTLLQPPPAPTRAAASDMQPTVGAVASPQPAREFTSWLAAAIALLFLLERWMASARQRRGQA